MKLLVFGFGYSAQYVAERLRGTGAEIAATVRTPAKAELLMQNGIRARGFLLTIVRASWVPRCATRAIGKA